MKQKRVTQTDVENVATETLLYKRLKLLALNMFEYEGLDELGFNIQERHIEKFLFHYGKCVWFEDPELGLLCLPGDGIEPNIMEDPTRYRVTGFNYYREVKAEDCVVMENNKLREPTHPFIAYFTNQLYEVVRTRDTNVKTLKLPFIVATTDKEVLTAKKLLSEIEENAWAVVVDKKVINAEEVVKVLQTGVKPYTADLTDLYHDILNEALTFLGINNANTDKKERLITSEADANNQLIESCSEMFLESRRRACEEINNKFGVNISVKLRNKEEVLEYEGEPTSEHITNEQ